jgi:hypothetical protein
MSEPGDELAMIRITYENGDGVYYYHEEKFFTYWMNGYDIETIYGTNNGSLSYEDDHTISYRFEFNVHCWTYATIELFSKSGLLSISSAEFEVNYY